jgi:GTP cyclohydrolase FolE2
MNAHEKLLLADIQAHADRGSMAIDRVGMRGIRHPIGFERTDRSTLQTVATIDMYVGLPSDLRGTHMSRFLLKRPDEKYLTECADDNPTFVEDLVREIAIALQRDPRIGAFVVESENFESIHNHSACALIRRDGRA